MTGRSPKPPVRCPGAAAACLLLALAAAGPARGQAARSHASADSVSVGERFYLSLAVEHSPQQTVLFPSLPPAGPADTAGAPLQPREARLRFGDVEVVSVFAPPSRQARADGVVVDSIVYEVATFALDSAVVSPVPIRLLAETDSATVLAPGLVVGVRSLVPPDAQGIQDLAPLFEFGRSWLWAVLLALGLLLLAALGYFLWRRRAVAAEPAAPAPPPATAYEEALARLAALEASPLDDPEAVKPFYVELTDVLRTYTTRALGVHAREETTRELVEELSRFADRTPGGLPDGLPDRVGEILSRADLVKFADARPAPEEGRRLVRETRTAIEQVHASRPRPAVGGDGAEPQPEWSLPEEEPPPRPRTVAGRFRAAPLPEQLGFAVAFVACFGLGVYAGLAAVIPLLAAGLCGWIARMTVPPSRRPMVPAFGLQAGHLLWLMTGYLLAGQAMVEPLAAILEIALLIVGLVWLLARPGPAVVIFLTLFQLAALVLNGYTLRLLEPGGVLYRGVIVTIVLRLLAILLLFAGLRRLHPRR